MAHSDFVAVHRSTSADARLSQNKTLRVANICARSAGSHAKDWLWQTSADAKRWKSGRTIMVHSDFHRFGSVDVCRR